MIFPWIPVIVSSKNAQIIYDHNLARERFETRFGLPTLTNRDAHADPMLGMFDFSSVQRPHPPLPAAPVDPAGVSACSALHP